MKKTIIIILIILIVLLVIIGGSLIFLYFASGHNVYKTASDALDSTDLTQALTQTQIQANNEKFAKYEGENQRGSVVNALLETVLTNNTTATSEGAKVTVNGAVTLGTSDRSIGTKADTSVLYNIACTRGSSGVITTITITRVGTTPQ